MDFYKKHIPILDYSTPEGRDLAHPKHAAYGAVPRDYRIQPEEMFDSPDQMQLVKENDWDGEYDYQEANKNSLEHQFLGEDGKSPAFVNLDQNGFGYCWSFSTAQAIMLFRMSMGLPVVRLSGCATAAIIKGGADEGGWGGLSAQWAREHGYAIEGTGPGEWPEHNRSVQNDTPALRTSMALHKVTNNWADLTKSAYDQNMTLAQLATSGFRNLPGPVDFNWWSHSVCFLRWVRIAAGNWGPLILNSWLNYGRFGLAVLQGEHGKPDGALTFYGVTVSEA